MTMLNRIHLTSEEVHVLCEIIGLPVIVSQSIDTDNDELHNLALRVLTTRGLIETHNEDEYIVDEKIKELMTMCALPDVMTVIELSIDTEYIVTFFPIKLKPGNFVLHQVIKGIHTFEMYDDVRDIAEQAVRSLRIKHHTEEMDLVPLQLNSTTLYDAYSARDNGLAAILQIIQQDAGDPITQQHLAEAITEYKHHVLFYVVYSMSNEIDQFTVIASHNAYLLITSNPETEITLTVQSISTQELCHRVYSACMTMI